MSADRHAEIMAILHQMQAAAQPGEQVTNIRKVKSYIAHLSGRISELEGGPRAKIECRREDIEPDLKSPTDGAFCAHCRHRWEFCSCGSVSKQR